MTAFCWPPSSGNSGGAANALASNAGDIDISAANPPKPGQVLTGVTETQADWRGPGLAYDPSIRFWTSSTNEATIGPNTWGFVSQLEAGPPTITVSIVSSIEAPPASSKFGLYVSAAVTKPVVVALIGTSQIQAPDGSLAATCTIFPNAYYEWILYHEDGVAVWGLVGNTSAIAKSISLGGSTPLAFPSTPPAANQVLLATSPNTLTWGTAPSGSSWTIAANINPRNWWRSNNVLSTAGLVDTIVDNGTVPKNFVSSGDARTTITADGLGAGRSYLDFTASQFYTAGIASDWTWLHNGGPFTIGIVFRRRNFASIEAALLCTMAWTSGGIGIRVSCDRDDAVPPLGTNYGTICAVYGAVSMQVQYAVAPQDNTICSAIFRRFRPATSQVDSWSTNGNAIAAVNYGDMFLRGAKVAYSAGNFSPNYSTAAPNGPLNLNRYTDGGVPGNAAIYEVFCTDRAISDYNAQQLSEYWRQYYLIGDGGI